MAKRTSKTVVANITAAQYEEALSAYAIADARKAKLTAQMDEQMTKIRDRFATDLSDLDQELEKNFEVVQVYATENESVLFAKKRSIETAYGTFGFRTGMPKLKLRKGFQWTAVLELLKFKKPDYVRVKEEVDKERLLIDRQDSAVQQLMSEIGVEIDQEERFFIELKKEEATA